MRERVSQPNHAPGKSLGGTWELPSGRLRPAPEEVPSAAIDRFARASDESLCDVTRPRQLQRARADRPMGATVRTLAPLPDNVSSPSRLGEPPDNRSAAPGPMRLTGLRWSAAGNVVIAR